MWWMYGFLILFTVYVCFLFYIRTQSPFWFHQPVYHTSMIYPKIFGYWSKPYILKPIQQIKPNLFSDFVHIQTCSYSDLQKERKTNLVKLIQSHYLDTEEFIYDITAPILDVLFTGQKYQSFVSCYYETTLQETRDKQGIVKFQPKYDDRPIACMTTNQQYIWFPQWQQSSSSKQSLHFPLYVWDYICTHHEHREKQLSRNMIQTHLYNQYKQSPVQACLFKKEVSLCIGVVPLVQYHTYTFFIQKTPISRLPIGYKIKRIESRTMNAWVELYTELPQKQEMFDVCVMPPLNNTMQSIQKETHYVILLLCTLGGQETVKGLYVFKDMNTVWDQPELQQKRTIQCVSSVCYDMSETLYFFRGFLHSIKELYYQKKEYGVLTIEHNSHNGLLLQRWNEKYPMHMNTQTAYYLYNMIYPKSPVSSERFFVFG